ncbi:MAG: hypothetical protein ABIV26_05985, partial [Candidatus Limnocylindrales bacterium]
SLLPPEVEKTLKKLGGDGDRVRGTLEREFAAYLDEKAPERNDRDLRGAAAAMIVGLLRPVSIRAGKQFAERFLDPDGPSFAEGLRKARERMDRSAVGRTAPEPDPARSMRDTAPREAAPREATPHAGIPPRG